MQQVPENILESFQGKYPHPDSKLIPHHLGEEGSDGAIYRFRDRDVLLKICYVGEENNHQDQLRFGKRLDFLSFLCERDVPVVEPIPSLSDRLFETVDGEGGCWVAYAMTYIRGKAPSPKTWNPDFLEAWGGTIGKLHQATREYTQWRNTVDPTTGEELLGWESEWQNFYHLSDEPDIKEGWQRIHEELIALPLQRDNFGLVHNDPHIWNMRWDGSKAILLDFEVANHHWFLNDIAIACQHVLFMLSGGLSQPMHHPGRLGEFLRHFLMGYSREYPLPDEWQAHLEPFYAYRRLLLYTVMAGWRRSDPKLQKSWKKMILERPDILQDLSL